ncbi:hypothetical protein K3495_g12750 [Podosphaera aphanis]|nr:hypothetical protein K3495_g12750 [Podosphaera aphanis]
MSQFSSSKGNPSTVSEIGRGGAPSPPNNPEQGNRPLNTPARVCTAPGALPLVNRRYLMSLGHRAATRGLQSLETAGAAAPPLPSSNMNDDDDVSGGRTASAPFVNDNRRHLVAVNIP